MPLYRDGHFFISSGYGTGSKLLKLKVQGCLDWKTVAMQRSEKGVRKGSVTFADGLLYTMSERNKVGLSEPTPEGHKLISQFEIPQKGEGPSWVHPVVCGGRLYIRHDDFLYAYDVRAN